jgi:hypothetical protein
VDFLSGKKLESRMPRWQRDGYGGGKRRLVSIGVRIGVGCLVYKIMRICAFCFLRSVFCTCAASIFRLHSISQLLMRGRLCITVKVTLQLMRCLTRS